ncbi:hypothetical protein [Spirosoma sp.]|uniref:hypothetical protein n=1 Tax=Spirosoma sp. TaxID=1899569 RepID=UPI002606DA79|nr:hypothetical protein [Spirosoma sp.]MCX6217646.1 hypothetical protein [Spirosoma sp.]
MTIKPLKHCPQGHQHIFLPESLLFEDCYYCPTCDEIYHVKLVKTGREFFAQHFSTDRFQELKDRALMQQARQKVSRDDLIKLGILQP